MNKYENVYKAGTPPPSEVTGARKTGREEMKVVREVKKVTVVVKF